VVRSLHVEQIGSLSLLAHLHYHWTAVCATDFFEASLHKETKATKNAIWEPTSQRKESLTKEKKVGTDDVLPIDATP
jgi:hypothetical protein